MGCQFSQQQSYKQYNQSKLSIGGFMETQGENNPEHLQKQGDNNGEQQVQNQIKNQEVIKEVPSQNLEKAPCPQNEQKTAPQQKKQQDVEVDTIEKLPAEEEVKETAEKSEKTPKSIEIQKDGIKKEDHQIESNNQGKIIEINHKDSHEKILENQVKLQTEQELPKKEQKHEELETQNKINQDNLMLHEQPSGKENDQEFKVFQEQKKMAAEKSQQIQQNNRPQSKDYPQIKIKVTYIPNKQVDNEETNLQQKDQTSFQPEVKNENLQQLQKEVYQQQFKKEGEQQSSLNEEKKESAAQYLAEKQEVEQARDEKSASLQQQINENQQQKLPAQQNIEDKEEAKQLKEIQNDQAQPEEKQKNQQQSQPKQDENKEQQNQESEKEKDIQQNSKPNKPDPIRMTQQNEEPNQETINIDELNKSQKQQIVEFVEYTPVKDQPGEISKTQQKIKPDPYKDIQNQTLLKRIQELEATVQQLKQKKQAHQSSANEEAQEKTVTQTIEKTQQKKKHKEQQVIHDQGVHGLVSQLAKTESANGSSIKKPVLQQKRYKRRKLDLSSLMDKNMIHASNIFNLTIGEIINPNSKHEQEKEVLKKQIRQLREKVLKLEEDKRSISAQKPVVESRRQNSSTGKKQLCGKLIKVSQLKASRISAFDDNDSAFKVNINEKIQTRSQRESLTGGIGLKNKVSTSSATQRQERQLQKQKDNQNNLSFRVRRPTAKSTMAPNLQGENSSLSLFTSQEKVDTFPISLDEKNQKLEQKILNKQWWEEPFIKPLQMPELPSPPSAFDSQEDLYTLGKLTFIAFGINIDSSKQMSVKKYKNCVYFNLGEKNNILWYFDGRFYIGEWQVHLTGEGEKSGQGLEYVPGKFIYQGEFKQGKRNKFGTIKILNKEKLVMYEGDWIDGNKCGQGKQIDEYGIKYWGEWKDNKREGFGKLKLEDGDYYEGNFQKGIKTGSGKEVFKNGDRYEGNYLANKFHGKGKYIWKNGSIYEGEFVHGIRSGQGKWRSSQTASEIDQYEGQYQNDKKNGYGKYRWADGSEYEGFFKDDLKEGEGTIRYKNGKVAKLLWKNGQPIKKIFSDEQKNYRQNQKSRQKIEMDNNSTRKISNRKQTISSNKKTLSKDE